MYDLSVKTSFIHFRGRGLSIRKISEVMGINRTTLIQWNKELYTDIKIAERDEYERIFESYACSKQVRVAALAAELGACYEQLGNRESRTDRLTLLNEIEKITKLINMETDDKRFSNMMEKSKARKDFPIIVNDAEKLRSYDPEFEDPDEFVTDWDDEQMKTYSEEEKAEALKAKEAYEALLDAADEEAKEIEENHLLLEAEEDCIITRIPENKKSRRILNSSETLNNKKIKKNGNVRSSESAGGSQMQ